MSRSLSAFLLGFLLLLGQIGAQSHLLSHLAESHHEPQGTGEPVCGECLAYGHFGAAALPVPLAWTALSAPLPAIFAEHPDPHPFQPHPYFGRAPPVLSA